MFPQEVKLRENSGGADPKHLRTATKIALMSKKKKENKKVVWERAREGGRRTTGTVRDGEECRGKCNFTLVDAHTDHNSIGGAFQTRFRTETLTSFLGLPLRFTPSDWAAEGLCGKNKDGCVNI